MVAVFGRQGIESFAAFGWMEDTDDDVLLSTFFMVLHESRHLQHFLAPSRPVRHGPWLALGQGDFDLEIAFWPDEMDDPGAAPGACPEPLARTIEYARALAVSAGAERLCLSHGLESAPRALLERGISTAPGFLSI